jgi:hypothetical protein
MNRQASRSGVPPSAALGSDGRHGRGISGRVAARRASRPPALRSLPPRARPGNLGLRAGAARMIFGIIGHPEATLG